jgi:MOSC domain-containing protein YiiM
MGYKGAVKAMLQSGFSGWYMRVNKAGLLAPGAKITVIPGTRQTSIAQQNQNLFTQHNQRDFWE